VGNISWVKLPCLLSWGQRCSIQEERVILSYKIKSWGSPKSALGLGFKRSMQQIAQNIIPFKRRFCMQRVRHSISTSLNLHYLASSASSFSVSMQKLRMPSASFSVAMASLFNCRRKFDSSSLSSVIFSSAKALAALLGPSF